MALRDRRGRWFAVAASAFIAGAAAIPVAVNRIEARQAEKVARAITGGDPSAAPKLIRRYGCSGCHTIPGVAGSDGQVGGQLSDLRGQVYIGGVIQNTPENLVSWIVDPQKFSPGTAMPVSGITPSEARDVAAFLYSR